MKKYLLLLLILPLFFACSNDDEKEDITSKITYKYKYVIYNDEHTLSYKYDVYNILIQNQKYKYGNNNEIYDIKRIDYIKFGHKSDTIYTNGDVVFFMYEYKDDKGTSKPGRIRYDIFLKENYPNVISISGFNDDRK